MVGVGGWREMKCFVCECNDARLASFGVKVGLGRRRGWTDVSDVGMVIGGNIEMDTWNSTGFWRKAIMK
jgi:hypothetical protein